MKKVFLSLIAIALFSAVGFAQLTIAGSPHDLRLQAWNAGGEICIACHTPHNAVVDYPLWNHGNGAAPAAFTFYTSTTMDAIEVAPNGSSLQCLACHDGTVGMDNYTGLNGVAGGTPARVMTGAAVVGTDLTNDHPVSFTWVAEAGLNPTTDPGPGTPTIADALEGGTKVQCASCHDVHDNTVTPFLRISNTGSALCLTCHNK